MPFEKGNKYGGKRENAGRRSREQVDKDQSAQQIARKMFERETRGIMGTYLRLATNGEDPATTRHAVDKLIPDTNGKEAPKGGDTFIQFVFGNTEAPRRDIDVGLPQEEQRGHLNGGAVRFIGLNGGS